MAIRNFNIPSPQDKVTKEFSQIPLPAAPTPEKTLSIGVNRALDNGKVAIIQTNARTSEKDTSIDKSILGTPIYTRVVIKKDANTDTSSGSSGNGFIKFDTCIVTVNQQRNIIKTPIQGRNGTIKEYISDGDYTISIKGSILGTNPDTMPSQVIKDCHTLFTEPNELWIETDILRYLGVQYVVIESYNINQVEGSRSRIDFDVNLLSDEPVEVQLGIKENA